MEKNKTNFTPEQNAAMGIESHLAVSANSGSGKTFVLVQRYINLIKNGVKPEHIVAITFTKKAAKEILERIYKNIENELQSNDCSELEKQLLLSAKKTMYKSSIGTIHKFCRTLIDLYGFEAGLPKSNVVIEEYEFKKIVKTIFNKTLKEFINQSSFSYTGSFTEVLRLYEVKDLRTIVDSVIRKLDRIEEIRSVNSSDFETMKDFLHLKFVEARNDCIQLLGQKTTEYIHTLESEVTTSNKFPIKKDAFFDSNHLIQGRIKESKEIPKEIFEEYILKIKDVIHGNNHTKQVISQNVVSLKESIKSSLEFLKLLSQFSISLIADYTRLQIQIVQFVFAILSKVQEYLQSESLYTQDGILQYALEIVRKPELQKDITEKFRYYMIDEFQDTNQLQLTIFSHLVPSLFSQNHSNTGNFYIVGDEKQSIYGFRSADVRVFGKAKEYIKISNEGLNILNDGNILLTSTFRLLPNICAIVNEFGRNFIRKEISEFDVDYAPLVCGRKWEYPTTSTITLLIGEYNPTSTNNSDNAEVLNLNDEENDEENGNVEIGENDVIPLGIVEMISEQILSMVNTLEIEEINSKTNQIVKRFCTFKDIAIISAERSKYKSLQREFSLKNIPSSFDSENNFFDLPEIEDIFSFLEFLYDPENDLALAAILRSPFFGFSTGDLIELSRVKGVSLWNKLQKAYTRVGSLNDRQQKLYQRTWNILFDLLPLAARLQITLLIKTIIIKTQYYQFIRRKTQSKAIQENIETLLTIVRQKQQEGFKTIKDFIDDIRERMNAQSSLSKNDSTISQDAVTILSIHGSKGLEFPVVIFLDNEIKNKRSIDATIDTSGLINVPLFVRKNHYKSKLPNPFVELTSQREKEKEFAEKKRKIYVALTRAKDHLIIAGIYKVTTNESKFIPNSAMDMLMKSLEIETSFIKGLEENSVQISRSFDLNYYSNSNSPSPIQTREITVPIQIITSLKTASTFEEVLIQTSKVHIIQNEYQTPKTLFYDTIAKNQIIHTASQLLSHTKDPIEYYYDVKLGINSKNNSNTDNNFEDLETDNQESFSGIELGSAVHTLITLKNICYTNDNSLNEGTFASVKETVRAKFGLRKEEIEKVSELTLKAWYYLDNFTIPRNLIHFESSFTSLFENDLIRGVFDCLIITENKAVIIDWKTNRYSSDTVNELIDLYSLQMKLYAFVCFEMHEIDVVETHLVFLNTSNHSAEVKVESYLRNDFVSLQATFREKFSAIHELFEVGIS